MTQNQRTAEKAQVAKAAAAAAPRRLTFWEQYRRKPQGVAGLLIVALYIAVAVFAPVISKYDPMEDMYLADNIAVPIWLTKVNPRYRELPPTMQFNLGFDSWEVTAADGVEVTGWEFEDAEGISIDLPATEAPEPVEGEDGADTPPDSEDSGELFSIVSNVQWDPFGLVTSGQGTSRDEADEAVSLDFSFDYDYKKPQTFSASMGYHIDAPSDASTFIELDLVTPSGKAFDLWDTTAYGSVSNGSFIVDARDFDLKMRLGISFFDEPADVVFSERGTYTVRVKARSDSVSGPVNVRIEPVSFGVLGLAHGLLGTDHMGSDLWAQLVYGTRIALAIGLSAAFIAVFIGTSVGLIAGYLGGIVDEVLMGVVDVLLSIPTMPVLIVLGALFGKSVMNVVILLALFSWMGIARIVRSQTLSLKERTFVEAAKAAGGSSNYIMVSHILPNTMPLIFANLVLRIPSAILTEASLSFLGLGDPRVPTWGRMLQNARQFGAFTKMAWWWMLPPGIALTGLAVAFVFIGNSVNEILNPRYRERS